MLRAPRSACILFAALSAFAARVQAAEDAGTGRGRDAEADPELADLRSILDQDIDMGLRRLMELEGLLNRSVESASRKPEHVFDSPLSATVLTREEIVRSGARSLMEALRLVPGLIVREQTSGNYDIHIRGLDNIPPHASLKDSSNTSTLVMVDYRVVYSYFQGGTFWDTLPIDVNDVERIEIVRGPAAAIHGPNAVTGAINIITRRPEEDGLRVDGTAQYTPVSDQRLGNAFLSYRKGAWLGTLSANYQRLGRQSSGYFSFAQRGYVANPADIVSVNDPSYKIDGAAVRFPHEDLALDRFGVNGVVGYRPAEELELTLQAGHQQSLSQKIFFDSRRTPLSTNTSDSSYAQLQGRYRELSARVAFDFGYQETPLSPPAGWQPVSDGNPYAYDFNVLDTQVDYRLSPLGGGADAAGGEGDAPTWSGLELRPSVGYRRAYSAGPLIAERDAAGDVRRMDRTLESLSTTLLAETTFLGRLKVVGGLRLEHYFDRLEEAYYAPRGDGVPQPKQGQEDYLAYELAATYALDPDRLLRAVYSRAHRAPFFFDSFSYDYPITFMLLKGNKALDLLTNDMLELGYRTRLTARLQGDVELFATYSRNYYFPFLHVGDPARGNFIYQYDTIDLKAAQFGATASLGYKVERLNATLFATAQKTRYWDYAPGLTRIYEYSFDPFAPQNQESGWHQGTPTLYGGASLNVEPVRRLQVNASVYAYTDHTLQRTDVNQGIINPKYSPSTFDIRRKLIVNAMVAYRVVDPVSIFLNARNVLDLRRQEYGWADEVPAVVMLGTTMSY